jgi:hypothetical protein
MKKAIFDENIILPNSKKSVSLKKKIVLRG